MLSQLLSCRARREMTALLHSQPLSRLWRSLKCEAVLCICPWLLSAHLSLDDILSPVNITLPPNPRVSVCTRCLHTDNLLPVDTVNSISDIYAKKSLRSCRIVGLQMAPECLRKNAPEKSLAAVACAGRISDHGAQPVRAQPAEARALRARPLL
jgi:hypothetical protein